ncbi:hypothetical protein Thiowin_04660 [Thiorhodovibrio winogradskyi]|uniref:Uncharacterized protein n=1 Tax=Thiorhodovibrio winogradskyi TaxID=77007 RepID=A0ABZ0SGU6_9GAMM|nr:hypothetical protein [Thiorhodovibrio winogradskyi]
MTWRGDVHSAVCGGAYYFLLRAPRQTGKNTSMLALDKRLNAEGRCIALTITDCNRIDFAARQPHGVECIGAALDPEHPPVIASLAPPFGVQDVRRDAQGRAHPGVIVYLLGALDRTKTP